MKFDTVGIVNKLKEHFVSVIILVVALNMAWKVAVMKEKALTQLKVQKEMELKKNQKLEDIAALEKKLDSVRAVVNAKSVENQQIFGKLDKFAKDAQVKIVMKPPEESSGNGYKKLNFAVTLTAANYHQLGRFIDFIEHSPDIFFVENLSISGPRGNKKDEGISASMTVSTIVIDGQG